MLILSREEIMRILADNYYIFLRSLPFENDIYMEGMGEARIKFLANLHITITKKYLPKKRKDRRYTTDYISHMALELLKRSSWSSGELIYEHMVPKTRYVKEVCEKKAKSGEISAEFIFQLLMKYFWTATIHKKENKLLSKSMMPLDWDGENIFARYNSAEIILIEHDKTYLSYESKIQTV